MHVETEFAQLLTRLVPGCDSQWIPASLEQVEEFENLAGQPPPSFYRWFLMTMGRSMGALSTPRRDMSIETLLSIYRDGFTPPHPKLLLIGCEPDEVMPNYLYCDLDRRIRNDALVCSFDPSGGPRQDEFETLREDLAWGVFVRALIKDRPLRCAGRFTDSGRDVLGKLEPVLGRLGFETLHRTGPCCGLYAREDVALDCIVPPTHRGQPYMFFKLGGEELAIRRVLGAIGTETSLEVSVKRWTPPLAG
jgi:hypothetical protein